MTTTRRRPTTAVPINGPEIRRVRMARGIEVADLASRIQVSRAYLTKLELGHSPRASVSVHAALVRVLQPESHDAFRADRTPAETH
ncbi:helix-turn-helix transcriptional regulator [Micromonospora sp. NPDC051196]|uniref:helix-turn-helix domain-containing protein n=1 Tax=Micromonospora sp. NPDC051196 TaxID=3155281 RepID=UPI0034342021